MNDKTAIVTGGGGQNIGQAISKNLASSGANVVILDIDEEASQSVVDDIQSRNNEAMFLRADVTNQNEIKAAVEKTVEEYGEVDILVNNAGGARGIKLGEMDTSTFRWNLERNLTSAAICTREALPSLKEAGGSVVFISSINAIFGGFSEVGYASAKAGLHALCRGLTADYSEEGIRFNVVCAGSVIGDSSTWEDRDQGEGDVLEDIQNLYPLKRYGTPEDIAEAVHFLSSERAAWITGVVLPVDGGLTATGNLPGGEWWSNI